jgi:membrane protein implicated in regulation of membrane protease activity
MVLLDPDILEAGRDLSPAVTGAGFAVGAFLWLFGAWTHRFWIVVSLTLTAGVYGLVYGPQHGMQPIVAGLLLAVAAGTLGLALMRVLAFVTGGWAFYVTARLIAPAADEPLLCFVVGGLFSVFLYRLWITAVSSVAGTILLAYSSLWLIGKVFQANTIEWAANHAPLWNWGLGSFAVLGILVQFVLHRRYQKMKKEKDEKAKEAEEVAKIEEELRRRAPAAKAATKSWWPFGGKDKSDKAA